MRHKTMMVLPLCLLLCACGGTSSEPSSAPAPSTSEPGSSSSSSSSKANRYVFDQNTRDALNEVVSKYTNRVFGPFARYQLDYEDANQTQYGAFDQEKMYYAEIFNTKDGQNEQAYYVYQEGDNLLQAQRQRGNGGELRRTYKYHTQAHAEAIKAQLPYVPYTIVPETLRNYINLRTGVYQDVVFDKQNDDGKGNIELSFTANEYNSSEKTFYEKPTHVSIQIKNYLVQRIYDSRQANYVFNQDEFEPLYPALDDYELIGVKPKASIEEAPLEAGDFLIDNDNHRTYYQILVYSFADSDGDGMGDFKGIADKLDYLQDLGIEGIWLSPILKASSYHGYDVEDYYTINSQYEVTIDGVSYGINYLLKECHKRGIKVLMDLVLNHTSDNHVWYKNNRGWYGSDNRFGFPELNYDKQEVRNAVKDVGKYWLDHGFDGFRLDAAMWIYNSGAERHQKNYAFWQDWCAAMKQAKPDCYIIGEVLDDNHDLAYDYAQAGFDSTFDFNALGNVIHAVKGENTDYASLTNDDISKAKTYNADYILSRALSNHDIGRFNQAHPNSSDTAYYVEDVVQIKLANAINALTPGNAFIYYGDELGLKGTCEDTRPNWYYDMNYRTPMPWATGRTRSLAYFADFHGNAVTTSTTASGEEIETYIKSDDSIYASLKAALTLKNSSETLQKGNISTISGLSEGLNGFDVAFEGKTIRIVFNAASAEPISYELSSMPLYEIAAQIQGNTATLNQSGLIAFAI